MSFKSIDTSNPIREDNIEKFVVPKSFVKPSGTSGLADTAGSSVMFVAALAAMTKNWTIAWPAIISAAICFVNYAPLKCSDTTSPLSSLFLALGAFFASYLPLIMNPQSVQKQT